MICRKCAEIGTLIIRKEYCYCDNCFLSYINHKFRSCIGKNKKIRWNEKVLVCLSGGASSISLLDLIYSAISIKSHKKLRITPYFLHLTGINKQCHDEKNTKRITEQCRKYKFEVNIVNINKFYSGNSVLSNGGISEFNPQLEELDASSTINRDLLIQMKRCLYIKVAKELQCPVIFIGDSTTALASKLLSNIAIGRGSQISNDIGFADMRDKEVELLRPMKDITREELLYYIKIKQLSPVADEGIKDQSLQSIINNFIFDLQENFPSTLTTVCKTAEKISSKPTSNKEDKCRLCESNLDVYSEKLTADNATHFSKIVSTTNIKERKMLLKTIKDTDNIPTMFPKEKKLCFSCYRNVSELNKSKLQCHLEAM